MNITPKPVKTFTREEPCTKVDLFNCFFRSGNTAEPRAVIEARGEIGVNAIKYLLKKDLAVAVERQGVDLWILTRAGEEWLKKGLARHLELYPGDAFKVRQEGAATNRPVVRRIVRRNR